jgi:hypothetical protein
MVTSLAAPVADSILILKIPTPSYHHDRSPCNGLGIRARAKSRTQGALPADSFDSWRTPFASIPRYTGAFVSAMSDPHAKQATRAIIRGNFIPQI